MRRLQTSNILIIGLKGLGVEIAKNVILAGVRSVTIYDPEIAVLSDLSAQFYLSQGDIGMRRDVASLNHLLSLNEYVPVKVLQPKKEQIDLTVDLADFQVIVLTESSLASKLQINLFTHDTDRAFISADVCGLFASVFCDFGENFVVIDPTGEQAVTGMISAVTHEENSVVTCLEDSRHNLEDGDWVRFREVKGMVELNDGVLRKVKILSPFTFSIGDTRGFSVYETGGVFEQVKHPRNLSFKSLSDSIKKPEFVISDFAKVDRMIQLHAAFAVLGSIDPSRWPKPRNKADAQSFIEAVKKWGKENLADFEADEKLLREFAFQARGYLAPMCAVIGGLVAQEVLKACSGKFLPLMQHFYFDSLESLPVDIDSFDESSFAPKNSRYDAQIAVFGDEFQDRIGRARGFIVGSGAIGCEILKLYALMGIGCNKSIGQLTLTDMDNIEKSNLNRQFLFRSWDVSKPKSLVAAQAVLAINPDANIQAMVDRVGPETENIFNDAFFNSLDFVTNALDNIEARKYMDQRCVFYNKPLLESGTLGTKGNTQIIIPHLTESYSSSQDPPEKTIPFCTLHNFPNCIEHTIEWAMDFFSGTFKADPETITRFLSFYAENASIAPEIIDQRDRLEAIKSNLILEYPESFADCVSWARLKFQDLFSNNIRQLLFNFPKDTKTSSGTLFWSGPKRAPTPISFDPSNDLHLDFVLASANLRAYIYGLEGSRDRGLVQNLVNEVDVPEFIPKSGVKIQVTENVEPSHPSTITSDTELESLRSFIIDKVPSVLASHHGAHQIRSHSFEKDDDSNFHLDFIAACSNLRATNYEISPTDRHHVKFIAGKIIPAIATTTALVSGLVSLEVYKIIDAPSDICALSALNPNPDDRIRRDFDRKWNLDRFKNYFINLALSFFASSSPLSAAKATFKVSECTHTFTLWDSFEISVISIPTLQSLLDHVQSTYQLSISMLSCGSSLLYSAFLPKTSTRDRLYMPLVELIPLVSKTPIPDHIKQVIFEVLCEDQEGNDVEVPMIKLKLA